MPDGDDRLWDGGYWYGVQPHRRNVRLIDDGTAPDSDHLGEYTSVANGFGPWEPRLPAGVGRHASFGPFEHPTHGWVYLVKLPIYRDASGIPGIVSLTLQQMRSLVGSRKAFEKLRIRYRGEQ